MFLTNFVFSHTLVTMFPPFWIAHFVPFSCVFCARTQHTDTTHTLNTTLCETSGSDVEWLLGKSSLNLSLVARLGGHSVSLRIAGVEQLHQVKRISG